MTTSPLRCHLLIGPPGSGKTTLARQLAPLLQGEGGEPGLVLSTDAIRAELFGDAAVQGPWEEIRSLLLRRLHEAVEAGTPGIIDATHARRPWRLLYTQQLQLSRPVEWIGWWLKTPLPQCKAWALRRELPVPEAVIEEFHASLNHRFFQPHRAEGFAALLTPNPAAGEGSSDAGEGSTDDDQRGRLAGIDRRVRNSLNRQRVIAAALLQICNPPPQSDRAERAAAYLASWQEVHGGNSDGYGDVAAIRADLAWLEANGFFRLDWHGDAPIDLSSDGPPEGSSVHGGYPALADRQAFRRLFTLLRHDLEHVLGAYGFLPQVKGRSHWTIERDWDLRAWLFRWGTDIRIEQPSSLRDAHLQQAQGVVALYGASS